MDPPPFAGLFVTLSKTRRGGRPQNLMSTLCLTQRDLPFENPGYALIGDTNIELLQPLLKRQSFFL